MGTASTIGLTMLVFLVMQVSCSNAMPSHTELDVSYYKKGPIPRDCIKIEQNQPSYCFQLIPDADINGLPVEIELRMYTEQHSKPIINLLRNGRNLHGYQAYNFSAVDFHNGVSNSIYGSTRTLRVDKAGALIRVRVLEAALESSHVSATTFRSYFTVLRIHLDVSRP